MPALRDTVQHPVSIWQRARDLLKVFPVASRAAGVSPATMRRVWMPDDGQPVVLLRWLFSEWCNYRCPYCPQTHDRGAPKGENLTAHAFDNFPIEDWIAAFDRHFTTTRLSMVMTGGESMLDRKNMTTLLNHLSAKPNVECIRIDTNAWWKPEQFADLNRTKLILMCTFHPSQVKDRDFLGRIGSYVQAGFNVGMVNYVMDDTNITQFEEWRQKFADKDLVLHPNPLWGSHGQYKPKDLDLMQSVLPEFDFRYRSGAENPQTRGCYFPALSYEMDLGGRIHVGCQHDLEGSFFDEALPTRPADKIPCPFTSCVCLDKYSFLDGCERNISANPLSEYAKALKSEALVEKSPMLPTAD